VCRNEVVTFTASGGSTYLWSHNNSTAATITAPSNVAGSYTYDVIGTNANGCVDTGYVALKVNTCTGLNELAGRSAISLYPNPSKGQFVIESDQALRLIITNELGQLIRTVSLDGSNNNKMIISDLERGIYFVTGQGSTETIREKIVIQ
jgi:hypothetical protein